MGYYLFEIETHDVIDTVKVFNDLLMTIYEMWNNDLKI